MKHGCVLSVAGIVEDAVVLKCFLLFPPAIYFLTFE